jgi:predicted permease
VIASSNYFATLAAPLFRGRPFSDEEERPGSGVQAAILSYAYWRKTGGDPQILGKTIRINGRTFTIVGITAEGFTGTTALISTELYLPLGVYETVTNDFEGRGRALAVRGDHELILIGRLRPGLTQAAAAPLLAASASRLALAYPAEDKDQTFEVHPLSRMSTSPEPQGDGGLVIPAVLLTSMAGVILLIASLNVANMMLARGTTRGKEISIRLALGGSRGHILRQLFAEGLVLSLLGGTAGLLLAFWGSSALIGSLARIAPVELVYQASPDARVLLATMGFCLLSTLLFGLGPAWRLSGRSILPGLKDSPEVDASGRPRRLFSRRNLLVLSQIALSLMLLTGAGLFVRSSLEASRLEPGFKLNNQILAEVDPSLAGYNEAQGRKLYRQLLDRLPAVPGVESVAIAATVPFGIVSSATNVRTAAGAPPVDCASNIVSEGYFRTLGITLLRGRPFRAGDGETSAAPVAILDQRAASRLWPSSEAIGKHVLANGAESEVVGIVGTVREHIFNGDLRPHIYVPFGQTYQSDMNIHLKVAASDPAAQARLIDAIGRQIRAVDDGLPVFGVKSLHDHLEGSFDLWLVETGTRLFLVFGGVALLLAMIGLYGVQAYAVAMRTREIGIRMALGATTRDALRMVLRDGLKLTLVGTAAGLVLSLGLGRILSSLLYRVSGADAVVLSTAPLLLAAVSLLACYLPARKASRIEPMSALRNE